MTEDLLHRLRYDCELAQNLGADASIVLQAADVRTTLDRIEAQAAEIEKLREERDDAISTLDYWFDRRKLGHEAVDQAVVDAAKGYLRTSRNGGMDESDSGLIEGVIADMARLGLFADLFARAALEQST